MSLAEICIAAMAVMGIIFSLVVVGVFGVIFYFAWDWAVKWSKWRPFVWIRRCAANRRARSGYWAKVAR